MSERARPRILLALLIACAPARLWADDKPAQVSPGAASGAAGTEWTRPEPVLPQLPANPVKSLPVKAKAPEGAKASPYFSLRALSLVEGEARVRTADGVRVLRPGDRLGRDLVSAVDVGVLVLTRPTAPGTAGGDARVVIRFDAQGKPTVRIYHAEDPTRSEPRPAQ